MSMAKGVKTEQGLKWVSKRRINPRGVGATRYSIEATPLGQALSRFLARRTVFAVSSLATALHYRDDCLDDLPSHTCPEERGLLC